MNWYITDYGDFFKKGAIEVDSTTSNLQYSRFKKFISISYTIYTKIRTKQKTKQRAIEEMANFIHMN